VCKTRDAAEWPSPSLSESAPVATRPIESPGELQAVDLIVTMGCSASDVCPAIWNGENRDRGPDDPHERPIGEVREIRDETETRVVAPFDEPPLEAPSAE